MSLTSESNQVMDAATKEKASKLKEEANQFYKEKKYQEAIDLYTEAINLDPANPIFYSNRSIAYLQIDWFGCALQDATKAIELDPTYVKAYFRRAEAHVALGRFKLALKDYEAVVKARPNNQDARLKFNECNKLVKKLAFERAIAVSCENTIDINSFVVEDSYSGPVLEDGKVTVKFVTELLETFRAQGSLHQKFAYQILLAVKDYFDALPSLVDITVPEGKRFTICGDIHGQYYDLLNIFKINGVPSEDNPYLFNGDFVDRGSFSVECIFTLFSYKLLYPDHFYMSRGNHESQTMNKLYGFAGEVQAKYSERMVDVFTEVYNCLPLGHVINGKVLVVHGGLFSKDGVTLDDLKSIERKCQPPDEGLMCEMLWSDPQDAPGRAKSKRGVGIHFGPDVTASFLSSNQLDYLVRSHEVKDEGYEVAHDGRCITVFSAPNYCDSIGNQGAFITINGSDLTPKFTTFDAVPHPNVKPMAYAHFLFNVKQLGDSSN